MKIRLILLSLVGFAAYIMLANFHSKMVKETEVSKDHGRVSAPQQLPAKPSAAGTATPTPIVQPEAVPAPVAQAPTIAPQGTPEQQPVGQKASEPPPVQLMVEPSAADTGEVQKLQEEIVERDQQIGRLLEAQEAIAAKYRMILAEIETGAGKVEAKDRMLKESTDRIQALTAEKEHSAAALIGAQATLEQMRLQVEQMKATAVEAKDRMLKESTDRIQALTAEKEQAAAALTEAQTALEQMRLQVEQMKAAAVEAKDRIRKESADRIQALTAEKEQAAAALTETQTTLEQLRHDFAQTKAAGVKAEEFLKEKETLLADAQMHLQERVAESNQLKTQLAETAAKLTAVQAELGQAGQIGRAHV